ncbi:MAG: hypothetical protein HY556_06265 [Euryarchaeota archaeon]|nr:hypothetical protein [Euryarchaeota archaeon]
MMVTTISVSDQTRRRLMRLKIDEGAKNMDELLARLLSNYRQTRFLEASELFKKKLQGKGLDLEDMVK